MKILKRFLMFFVAAAVCSGINAFAAVMSNESFQNAVDYKIDDSFYFYSSQMNGGTISN